MKTISELPEPYRKLAEKRREEDSRYHDKPTDYLGAAFSWEDTPEKDDFWIMVFDAETVLELPPIPEEI